VSYLERTFQQDNVRIVYIYCNYKEPNQSAVNLLASVLQQLIQTDSDVSKEVIDLYKSHTMRKTRPGISEYSELLKREVQRYSKVFLIIDALDECIDIETRETLLTEIAKVETNVQSNLHLLVTARPHISINQIFKEASSLEIYASNDDIKAYLQGRIETTSRLKRQIVNDPDLGNKIITTILGNAQGMSVSLTHLLTFADILIGFSWLNSISTPCQRNALQKRSI
jgi:hypothetical protein